MEKTIGACSIKCRIIWMIKQRRQKHRPMQYMISSEEDKNDRVECITAADLQY